MLSQCNLHDNDNFNSYEIILHKTNRLKLTNITLCSTIVQ